MDLFLIHQQEAGTSPATAVEDSPSTRRSIVDAYNRWCFAKDLPFKTIQDIDTLIVPTTSSEYENNDNNDDNDTTKDNSTKSIHYYVKWKDAPIPNITESRLQAVEDVLTKDPSAVGEKEPAEVWINGIFEGMLQPTTLSDMIEKVSTIKSLNVGVKRSENFDNIIRIERRFRGGLRHKQDIFDHIMDNLYALEDVEVLENTTEYTTTIGSATLPDWIMGGELTSRLHIRQDKVDGGILFLRPLYDDNITTADRRFRLKKGIDDEMIALVEKELQRIQYLASLPLPHPELTSTDKNDDGIETTSADKVAAFETITARERQHRRNRRRFFGM